MTSKHSGDRKHNVRKMQRRKTTLRRHSDDKKCEEEVGQEISVFKVVVKEIRHFICMI